MERGSERAEQFRKLAEIARERDLRVRESHVKQAAAVLKALKGLHILRQKSEESPR